jgi:stage V sporulation protein D (sporulation-specific penicillin-binding protein)
MYICSCVAFAPADDPEIAIIIMVDEPTKGILYGSLVAAPYIAKTLETVLPYLGVEAVYTEEEKILIDKEIPDYTSLPVKAAVAYAESRGLEVQTVGKGTHVISQIPKAGSVYSYSGKIVFYTDNETEKRLFVPDVVGKSLSEVGNIISNNGFNVCFSGAVQSDDAEVFAQYPAAGDLVAPGSVVTVEMRVKTAD